MAENIFNMIHGKFRSFSKGQKRIATFITEDCEKAAFMTASKLGKTVNVSESTVVRFAMELGYDGYPGMQDAMRQMLLNRVAVPQNRKELCEAKDSRNSAADSLRADAARLLQAADSLNTAEFSAVVEAVYNGKRIYLLGFRSAFMLPEYFAFHLRLYRGDVYAVTSSGEREMLEQLIHIEAGDVLLVFCFSEDVAAVIGAAYCKSKGATVVAITDSGLSPLTQESDYILAAKIDKLSGGETLVAPMGIINALCLAISEKYNNEMSKRVDDLDQFYAKYYHKDKGVGRR